MASKVEPGVVLAVGGLLLASNVLGNIFGDGQSGDNLNDLPEGWDDNTPQTLSNQALIIMADEVDQALLGGAFTEDEDAVYSVLGRLGNTADFYGLVREFGVRCMPLTLGTSCGTLPQCMVYFLNTSELAECNRILASKSIPIKVVPS